VNVLVDTSIWLDHLRYGLRELDLLLEQFFATTHPFVAGELACGNLRDRGVFLAYLNALPQSPLLAHEEAMRLVEIQRLAGTGLNWVDVHLLGSAMVSGAKLWTRDQALHKVAERLGIAFSD
jgi:predicted nucleic acid-binding protein